MFKLSEQNVSVNDGRAQGGGTAVFDWRENVRLFFFFLNKSDHSSVFLENPLNHYIVISRFFFTFCYLILTWKVKHIIIKFVTQKII